MKKEKRKWILQCAAAAEFLYGDVPYEIFAELCEVRPETHVTPEEVREALRSDMDLEMDLTDGGMVVCGFYRGQHDYARTLQFASAFPYRIPTEEEILELHEHTYPWSLPEFAALRDLIYRSVRNEEVADAATGDIYDILNDTFDREISLSSAVNMVISMTGNRVHDGEYAAEVIRLVKAADAAMPQRRRRGGNGTKGEPEVKDADIQVLGSAWFDDRYEDEDDFDEDMYDEF